MIIIPIPINCNNIHFNSWTEFWQTLLVIFIVFCICDLFISLCAGTTPIIKEIIQKIIYSIEDIIYGFKRIKHEIKCKKCAKCKYISANKNYCCYNINRELFDGYFLKENCEHFELKEKNKDV